MNFGIEICEDLWSIVPPSNDLALNGANLILNLSSSNELIGKYEYRKSLVKGQSSKLISGYVYTSSGVNESTTDVVFSGHAMIAENGQILKESTRFQLDSQIIMDELTRLHKAGNTILMVTHNPDLLSYASRVIHMKDGQIDKDEELTENNAFRVTKRTISTHKSKWKGTKRSKRLVRARRLR